MSNHAARLMTLTVGLAVAVALTCGAQSARPDLNGKWTLDKSASRSADSDKWVSAERIIEQNTEKIICATTISMDGGECLQSFSEPTDGTWRANGQSVPVGPDGPSGLGNKPMTKVEWADGKLLVQYKSAMEEQRETWTLSPDGRTLTIVILHKVPGGNETASTEVYRKQ